MYTIKAKPTTYNNIIFNSRLEARYAYFFTLLKIEYQYEPLSPESGYNWLPDFMILLEDHEFYVEVKPEIRFLTNQLPHIQKQAEFKPVLVLTSKPTTNIIIYNQKGKIKTESFLFFTRFNHQFRKTLSLCTHSKT